MTLYGALACEIVLFLVLSCVLAVDSRAAGEDPVGLPLGIIHRATMARFETRRGGYRLGVVAPGEYFEILPLSEGNQLKVLLSSDKLAWLPASSIDRVPRSFQLSVAELSVRPDDVRFEPFRHLPRGMKYFWLYKANAKLHVCSIDLELNPCLEFVPYASAFYNHTLRGREKKNTILSFARRMNALVAINGSFFINCPGANYGEPLGNVIIRRKVAFELTRPAVLARNRTFLAWTDRDRVVLGNTNLPATLVLELNEADEFCPDVFSEGERIVSLLGGLGWLVRNGDARAWMDGVESQFGAEYYSYKVRRPQTVVGVAGGGRKIWLVTQEGYPHSKRRMSLPELADFVLSLGCENAAFADGGGSTEMVIGDRCVVRTENLAAHRLNSTALLVLERREDMLGGDESGCPRAGEMPLDKVP